MQELTCTEQWVEELTTSIKINMKKIVYILALGAFGIITTEMGVIGIMPDIAKDLHISIDTAGWLLSAFAITIALTGPFSVLFTAGFNRKWMMAIVLLTFVVSNIISYIAPNFEVLMMARLIPAFLHPVFWSVATVAAAKLVPPEDAPKAVGIVFAGMSVATVLGIPISTYISGLYGWRSSFLLGGAINLAAFICLAMFVPSMPPASEKLSYKSQLVIFNNRKLWINIFTTLLMMAGMFATYSYLATYLLSVTHMSSKEVSVMLLLFGTTGIAGNWLVSKALSKDTLITTRWFLFLLIGVHILAYAFGLVFILMSALILIWGFVHTAGFLIANIRITGEATEAPELASSLMVTFANAGLALGTMLGGLVITHYGVHSLIWMSIVLLTAALGLTFLELRKNVQLIR
jgi:predicted MFS family arabinose efflux permease